jgi:hypothetical protein
VPGEGEGNEPMASPAAPSLFDHNGRVPNAAVPPGRSEVTTKLWKSATRTVAPHSVAALLEEEGVKHGSIGRVCPSHPIVEFGGP